MSEMGMSYLSNPPANPLPCSRNTFASSRICSRHPPLKAFCETVSLPSIVFGPVDFSHGCHCLISSDCRACRSGVQPFAIMCLQ